MFTVLHLIAPGADADSLRTRYVETHAWVSVQYNSYSTHYKEAECLRQQVEPFLYNFGVDIVFHGERPSCHYGV